jgi:hypothetical protein
MPESRTLVELDSFQVAKETFMIHPVRDARRGLSALMAGPVAQLIPASEFSSHNIIMARDRYSYEGNWLFCTFDHPEFVAARLGFGLGKFHWQDYGLETDTASLKPISFRVEVITPVGVHACLFSDNELGTSVTSDASSMDVRFHKDGEELFRLRGWPKMNWHFRSPDGSMGVDLQVIPHQMAVWPDCILPNNTFSMCIGPCDVTGRVFLESREIKVNGGGVYDHPRVLLRPHDVPSFGWYLYAPLHFPDGTFLVSYYLEDGLGQKDEDYSTAFLILPDQSCRWLSRCQVRSLKMDGEGLPTGWEAELTGQNLRISYRSRIIHLPSVHLTDGLSVQDGLIGKYPAFPLLMDVEGECTIDGVTRRLTGGSGISEFLVRKGYRPRYP